LYSNNCLLAKDLAKTLSNFRELRELDFEIVFSRSKHTVNFLTDLWKIEKLERFSLSGNEIKLEMIQDFIFSLEKLNELTELSLFECRMTRIGLQFLGTGILKLI
jgi:Ran GTPase-activating protein (RanGAP) involved in mRNA processing and transport